MSALWVGGTTQALAHAVIKTQRVSKQAVYYILLRVSKETNKSISLILVLLRKSKSILIRVLYNPLKNTKSKRR